MKHLKLNHMLIALLFSGVTAFATSKQSNFVDPCSTVPTVSGPSINSECPYSAVIQCCYIAAGSSSQFVTQTQGGASVIIRRNTSQPVTIFGIKN
ncbi:hypothetical protein C7475_10648 [Chitinophaga sp. S165]|nr:hypothetical protein C7475_10648 [Chitinophaga sp. S165]